MGWCIAYVNPNKVNVSKLAREGETVYIASLMFRSRFRVSHLMPSTVCPPISAGALYLDLDTRANGQLYYTTCIRPLGTQEIEGPRYLDATILWRAQTVRQRIEVSTYFLGPWYLSYISASVDFNLWKAVLWKNESYQLSMVIDPLARFYPKVASIGVFGGHAYLRGYFYFDNLVVTVDRPPWFVEVGGLPEGWRVRLLNNASHLISEAVAGSDGVARLVVAPPLVDLRSDPHNRNGFIFPGGIIEIYDERGVLFIRKQFDLVIGGDRYDLVPPLG